MKPEAVLINLGRGGLVDEEALIESLRAGRIAGAALDVFREEPLPETSPLWEMPNVLISPPTHLWT
jgi:phosphoglycerate dehydrogenase-like enzyme